MSWWPERAEFRWQLGVWALRGALCAAPSFFWALFAGFQTPGAWIAMCGGELTYVVAYAWITALPAYRTSVATKPLGWALSVAGNARAALAPVMFFTVDGFLGTVALHITGAGGLPAGLAKTASPGLVYFITLVQGALVSLTLFALAVVLAMARTLWLERK